MITNAKIREMIAAGFSLEEVRGQINQEYSDAVAAGFTPDEADAHIKSTYGVSFMTSKEDQISSVEQATRLTLNPVTEIKDDNNAQTGKPVSSLSEAALAGYEGSILGLAVRGRAPSLVLTPDSSILQKTVGLATQQLGDLPTLVAGGAPGTLAGNPVAAAAGAMGLTEGVRTFLIDQYTKGAATTPKEVFDRTANVLLASGKAAATGAAGGKAGEIASALGQGVIRSTLSELTAMTVAGSALEGHLPTAQDFIVGGMSLGGVKLGGFYTRKLTDIFIKTGKDPRTIIQDAKIDPTIVPEISSVNSRVPSAYGSGVRVVYGAFESVEGNVATRAPWVYTSKDHMPLKATTEGAKLEIRPLHVDAGTRVFVHSEFRGAEVFKQFLDSKFAPEDLKAKLAGANDEKITHAANKAFNNPSDELISYLSAPKNEGGVGNEYQAIQVKHRMLPFNQESVRAPNLKPTRMADLNEALTKVNESLSVGDKTPFNLNQKMADTYQSLVDKFAPLNEGAAPGKITVPYFKARMLMGSPGVAMHWLQRGVAYESMNGDITYKGKSLKSIINGVKDVNEFRAFLQAKATVALSKRGLTTGTDISAATKVATDKVMTSTYGEAAKDFFGYHANLLQYSVESGLITKKRAAEILAQNKDYMPLDKVVEAYEPGNKTAGVRENIDPLETAIRMTFLTVRAAEQNKVKAVIAKHFGIPISSAPKDFVSKSATRIEFYDHGAKKAYSVPEGIAKTVKVLDAESVHIYNGIMKGLATGAGVLRAGAVFAPDFMSRNLWRDQWAAGLYSNSGYVPFVSAARGLAALVSTKTGGKLFPGLEDTYWRWLREGGANANLTSLDRNYTQEMLSELTKTPVTNVIRNPIKSYKDILHLLNPLTAPKHVVGVLRAASETSEVATRLGEFMAAQEAGFSSREAAYQSRDLLDFMRIGAATKGVNAIAAFFNAKVQGIDKFVREMQSKPSQLVLDAIAGITVPSILLSLVQNDIIYNDPDSDTAKALKEIPAWQRHAFWIVPTPYAILRLPKPHEVALMFASPIEMFIDYAYEQGHVDLLEKLGNSGFVNAVLEQAIPSPMPSVVAPALEVATNHSFFTGNNIIPPFMEKELPETQYNRNTSELAKAFSRLLGQIDPLVNSPIGRKLSSPLNIEHLITGWTGTLGRYTLQLADEAAKQTILKGRVEPTKTLSDMPVIKSFVVRYPSAAAKSINDFDTEAKKVEGPYYSAMALMKEGRESSSSRAIELLEGPAMKLNQMRAAMGNISAAIRHVEFTDALAPDEKRKLIDTMYSQMIMIAGEGLELIRSARKQYKETRNAGQ